MAAKSPDKVHLVGYRHDGRRVNRRYKTHEAADRMAKTMPRVSYRMLDVFVYSDIETALAEMEGRHA